VKWERISSGDGFKTILTEKKKKEVGAGNDGGRSEGVVHWKRGEVRADRAKKRNISKNEEFMD